MEYILEGPETPPTRTIYKLLIGSIVPRPIAWVSTVNAEGQPNLAPYSFFNGINSNPPHLLFCPGVRATDHQPKDSLLNVQATGEFVVNVVTEELAEAMNITATEFPADVNEFEAAGLTPAKSRSVLPPRIAESPINFECRVTQVVAIGDLSQPGSGAVVIGRIVCVHVRDDVLLPGDKIDIESLRPVGRLAGAGYTRVRDIFEMKRPPSQVTPSRKSD
ncbi:MAG: flavin reductase family protein [Chloroflexi bacterium]|nr:flavin reductase family protein [Chloroflexota bacterium]